MIIQRVDMDNGNRVDVCTDAIHGYGMNSNHVLKKPIKFTSWEMDKTTGFITMFGTIQLPDKTIFIRNRWWQLQPKPVKMPCIPIYVTITEDQIEFKDVFRLDYTK